MSEELKNKVLLIVRQEIESKHSAYDVCKSVADRLNCEFGVRWHCIVHHNFMADAYVAYDPHFYIAIQFGPLIVQIFKIYEVLMY